MGRKLTVLVACETSGVVRDAFRGQGHAAYSCDIKPADHHGPHLHCDVRELLCQKWDMMIAHPPCTHLAVSGARWFKDKEREQEEALEFVSLLMSADIPMIAIENPVSVISTRIRKPDQIIQPWQFGHPESKKTCLWLKGLPPLRPTDLLPMRDRWENQTPSGQNRLGPSPDRAKIRSRTYKGIARAMALQWGSLRDNPPPAIGEPDGEGADTSGAKLLDDLEREGGLLSAETVDRVLDDNED